MAETENPTPEGFVRHAEPDKQTTEPNSVQQDEDDALKSLIIAAINKNDRKSLEELIERKRGERAGAFEAQPKFESPWDEEEDIPENMTPLMIASIIGRDKLVRQLLSENTDFRAVDDTGNTALHLASMWGTREVVELLLDKDIALRDTKNHAGESPLHVACLKSNFPTAECLIERGANVDLNDRRGYKPIHHAAWHGSLDIVKAILERYPEQAQKQNVDGNNVLLNAAQAGHEEMVKYLVAVIHTPPNHTQDTNGETALHLASWGGDHEEVARMLLDWCSDLLEIRNNKGRTPLLAAAYKGRPSIFQFLLQRNAKSDIVDTHDGDTALHLAAWNGCLEIVGKVIEKHPEFLHKKNGDEWTPLFVAADCGRPDIIDFLLTNGAKTDILGYNKDTVLHVAARNGNLEAFKLLWAANEQNVNRLNSYDESPILEAGLYGHLDIIRFICSHNEDIEIGDSYNSPILHHAIADSESDLVKLLLDRGAIIQADDDGRTPLHKACYKNKLDAVGHLLGALSKDPQHRRQIINAKDTWNDTALADAAAQENLPVVLRLISDPGYFLIPQSLAELGEVYVSDKDEQEMISKLLLDSIPEEGQSSNQIESTTGSAGSRVDDYLEAVLNWAISNQSLDLVKRCISRARVRQGPLELNKIATTGLHTFAMRSFEDTDQSEEILYTLLGGHDADVLHGLIKQDRGSITPLQIGVVHANQKLLEFLAKKTNLGSGFFEAIFRRASDKEDAPISLAASGSTPRHRDMQDWLWKKVDEAVEKGVISFSNKSKLKDIEERVLELAARYEPPKDEIRLMKFMKKLNLKPASETDPKTEAMSVLETAISLQLPKVVWWLLSNGAYLDERNITRGLNIVAPNESPRRALIRDVTKDAQIQKLLKNPPPFTKHGPRFDDHRLPVVETKDGDYQKYPQGIIVDFLASKEDGQKFRLKLCDITAILKPKGPDEIMSHVQQGYDEFFSIQNVQNASENVAEKISKTDPKKNKSRETPNNAIGRQTEMSRVNDLKQESKTKQSNPQDEKFRDGRTKGSQAQYCVRWIHVPKNDMKCLKNLLERHSNDNGVKNEIHRPLLHFLQESCSKVPAGGNKSYLKPQCLRWSGNKFDYKDDVKDDSKNGNEADNKVTPIALWMPFLFWTGKHPPRAKERETDVSDQRTPNPQGDQEYMTLDQYYYVSLEDTGDRDEDQVLGRFSQDTEQGKSSPSGQVILIINQLWVWVLDDKTILTSTTKELEDEGKESFLQCVLETFQQVERNSQQTTHDITELILRTAIGLFQRKDVLGSDRHEGHRQEDFRSVLDVFRECISKVRHKEADLFNQFMKCLEDAKKRDSSSGRHSWLKKWSRKMFSSWATSNESPVDHTNNSHFSSTTTPKKQSNDSNSERALDSLVSTGPSDHSNIPQRSEQEQYPKIPKSLDDSKQAEATGGDQAGQKTCLHQDNDDPYSDILPEINNLREIKDIYDELKILKGLAEDQEHVWEQFWGCDVLDNRTFNYDTPSEIIEEIDEMLEQAKSVLDDLNSLLDLKQKQANINEAQSSRDQSDTIMVFTVITILFLPATFLTGLFALNISNFPHQGDELAYEGSWIFPIITLVSLGTSGIFSLIAFNSKWFKTFKWERKETHNPEGETVNKTQGGGFQNLRGLQRGAEAQEQEREPPRRLEGVISRARERYRPRKIRDSPA